MQISTFLFNWQGPLRHKILYWFTERYHEARELQKIDELFKLSSCAALKLLLP